MKRLLSIFLLCAMLASLLASCAPEQGLLGLDDYASGIELENSNYTTQTAWGGKTSDKTWYTNDPSASTFYIADGADLKGFVDLVAAGTTFEGKTVELKNDINLADNTWSITESNNYFKGTFDGKGFTIGGFKMTCTVGNQSVLGPIGGGATVKNVNVEKGVITLKASTSGMGYVGVVISKIVTTADTTTTVSNVTVNNTSKITYHSDSKNFLRIGGIVGGVTGNGNVTIENCSNAAAITGREKTAGIVGDINVNNATATVKNCANTGAITVYESSSAGQTAGIMGCGEGDQAIYVISDCSNSGKISYAGDSANGGCWVGGIAGYIMGTSSGTKYLKSVTITNCTNTGTLSVNRTSAGLVGFIQRTEALEITDCTVDADITFTINSTSNLSVGGLVGAIHMKNTSCPATITGCKVTGVMRFKDPLDKAYTAGGLFGIVRTANLTVTDCEVSVEFENKTAGDSYHVITGANEQSSTIKVTGLTYVCHNNIPQMDSNVEMGEVSYFKAVGQQRRTNTDGTVDLRFVFGVGNIQETDVAIGFEVIAKELDTKVTIKTEKTFCSTLYEEIKGDGKTYKASDFGCDYFYVLTIINIPEADVEMQNGITYLKDVILSVIPYSMTYLGGEEHRGIGLIEFTIDPERHTFRYEDFTPYLPDAFKDLTGVLSSKNVVYKTPNNVACQEYKQLGTNDQYVLNKKCTCTVSECTCGWGATGTVAYKNSPTMPYHYYIDITSYTNNFGAELDRYEAYHTWEFEVAEDGYYEFCFRIRVNGSDGAMQTRYALVQFDGESYGSQTEFYYSVAAHNTELRDNGTNHDSYIVGYGRDLTAGKHTITFRLPYDTTAEIKTASFHIRDIYLLKTSRQPAEADIPKLEGATLYDGNFDSAVTYVLDNTTKAVLDTYREKLVAAGFELKEQRQTEYQFSKFDTANYKNDNTMYNDFYLYTNDQYMVYAYYTEGAKAIRVVVDNLDAYDAYMEAHDEETYTKVTTPMFAILDIGGKDITLKSGANAGKTVSGVTNGMCLVFRLSDGRFIVVDGGFWNQTDTEGEGVARLYDWLQKNDHLEGENNKIVIANWIITHHHSDHISVAYKFDMMKKAGTFNVEVQNYMYNFPSYEYGMSVYGTNLDYKNYNMYYPHLHYTMNTNNTLVVHSGFTYQFADCSIEILFTHEDFYPEKITSYNNSNSVFKITLGGKTFLIAGDLEEPGQKRANKQTGTLLEADFLQMTHHGYNGQVEFYKYIVGLNSTTASGFNEDTIVICPLPKGEVSSLYDGTSARHVANKWLRDLFRKEDDQANDNMHFAIENWVYTDFN